jgi:hypothetical protein
MEVAATIISLVALVFSALSLYFTVKREGRDEVRFSREQKRAAAEETRGISAIYKEGPTPAKGDYGYRYELVNTDEFGIDNATGWLVDEEGVEVRERTLGPPYLMPEEKGELRLVARSIDRPLQLHLSWLAAGVQHPDKTSGAPVPRELA